MSDSFMWYHVRFHLIVSIYVCMCILQNWYTIKQITTTEYVDPLGRPSQVIGKIELEEVSSGKCHFSTTMTIFMHQLEDMRHNIMH